MIAKSQSLLFLACLAKTLLAAPAQSVAQPASLAQLLPRAAEGEPHVCGDPGPDEVARRKNEILSYGGDATCQLII